jgi:hypothetical protein
MCIRTKRIALGINTGLESEPFERLLDIWPGAFVNV